jgi:glycosyl hydrolase family 18 (putative chitinase)
VRRLLPLAAAALAAAGATAAIAVPSASASTASAAATASAGATARPLPSHLFAPYFETYDTTDGGLAQLSRESGAKYLTLAFLQTDQPGSCTAYWNGDTSAPVSATAPGSFGADIAAIQRAGGNVIPSFGGYSADTTNTDIADSCTSVDAIAQVYESLVRTYHVTRIDLDVEADSLSNTAGIQRRNQAITETEAWARARGLAVQFSYTVPVNPTGLTASGLAVLQDAVAEHAAVSVVNIMTFDYYFGTSQDMLADTKDAASAVYGQLRSLYPAKSPRALWHMIGVTEMPGIDDFGPDETFTTTDAPALLHWAVSKGIDMISFWALQRDNGGCPGTKGAGSCSGVAQPAWYFSHVFEPFSQLPANA